MGFATGSGSNKTLREDCSLLFFTIKTGRQSGQKKLADECSPANLLISIIEKLIFGSILFNRCQRTYLHLWLNWRNLLRGCCCCSRAVKPGHDGETTTVTGLTLCRVPHRGQLCNARVAVSSLRVLVLGPLLAT